MLSFEQQKINEFVLQPYLLVLVSLLSAWFFRKKICKDSSKKSVPPSPPKLPILGNLHQLSALTHRSFQSLGTKYGPIMLLQFGNRPVIIIQSGGAAREMMKTHDLVFADRAHTTTARRLLYDLKDLISAPYGEYWRKLRRICVLQLLSGKRVQSFGFIREEETASLLKKITSSSSSSSFVNLSELFDSLTNDVICRAAFGRKYSEGEDGQKFLSLVRETVQLMGTVSVGDFIPCLLWINCVNGFNKRVNTVANQLNDFLDRVIQHHLHDKDARRDNFVDILLNIYDHNSHLDRITIKAIILDIMFGGTDTSAVLEWAMTELLRHPLVLNKLQTEVREILKDKESITDEDLGEMQYLKAAVKETLRLHPPIPVIGRVAREDVQIMGYDIAAGTIVFISAWAIGRDPVSWDEPDKFMPERFLNSSLDIKGLDFTLIPFGSGRRGCPGIGFAMKCVQLVLANLMHKFEWGLPNGEDLDTTEQPGASIHRKHPLLAMATSYG